MKKKPVKNRKRELKSKRLFYASLIFGLLLVIGSVGFVLFRFFTPATYISPVTMTAKPGKIQTIPQSDVFVQDVRKALAQANISYTNVQLSDTMTCQITLSDNEEVILSTQKDISVQIASLQLISSRLTMEGKRFTRLDLRYDKPVLSE